ncbi:unnamed protein product, partial [Amoebophrya sp. A120]
TRTRFRPRNLFRGCETRFRPRNLFRGCEKASYALQKCLGLETCDAEWRSTRRPRLLAQHDKFLSL